MSCLLDSWGRSGAILEGPACQYLLYTIGTLGPTTRLRPIFEALDSDDLHLASLAGIRVGPALTPPLNDPSLPSCERLRLD